MNWSRWILAVGVFLSSLGFGPWTYADSSVPWLADLRQAVPEEAALTDAVNQMIHDPAAAKAIRDPDLAVITYHVRDAKVADLVLQLFQRRPGDAAPLINPHGVVHDRIGDSMGDASDKLLGLVYQPAQSFGDPEQIHLQQRALNLSMNGDLTLLREQTIDPLHVVAIMPQAAHYLPSSLGSHVNVVLLAAVLNFGEWRGQLHLITDDADNAEQVGNIVAGWRDLAGSLAGVFAGYSSGKPLRDSLQSAVVQVSDTRVTASGSIPASTVVRAAKELAGHGGGCPAGAPCSPDKVAVCHNGHTLCIAPAAVAAHLAQGDFCGPCMTEADAGHGHDRDLQDH